MTLTQSMELGEAGTEIQDMLSDIRYALNNDHSNCGDKFFENSATHWSRNEYIENTIEIIEDNLLKLKAA